jgi:hypothetical protein
MPVKGLIEECAIYDEGPCTCGAEEALEEVLQEEAPDFLEN